ncbi:hypothetical protein LGR51_21765, partial [Pseudomonas sp. NP21570]|nr:hypothetical protein [Pseudomonas sp. NP21570]
SVTTRASPPEGRAKQREVEAEKQDKRSLEIEDINAKPLHVRWIVNHLARRAWRGTQFLQQDLARHQARVDKLIRLDYLEERYGPDSFEFKAQLRRVNLGEATEQTLKAFFPGYSKLDEADIGLSDVATSRVGNVDDENPHTGDQ